MKEKERAKKELEIFREYLEKLKACRVYGRGKNWYKGQLILATEGMINSLEKLVAGTPMDPPADIMKLAEIWGKKLKSYLEKNE